MIISDFTTPQIDLFIKYCNFVDTEKSLFKLRSEGIPLEEIAERLHLTPDGAKKVSQRVDKKIEYILFYALLALS